MTMELQNKRLKSERSHSQTRNQGCFMMIFLKSYLWTNESRKLFSQLLCDMFRPGGAGV